MLVATKNITDYSRRLLVFICLGHFCVDFMLGIWSVFKTMAGLDIALAGFLAGGCVVLGEGSQCYFGGLSDRGYSRMLLILGISLAASASFFSYSESYLGFLVLFIGTCLGSAAFHPTAASLLSSVNPAKRSLIMGFFTASGMIGLGVSQLTFSWAYETYHGSTAILALPALLLSLAIVFLFRSSQNTPQGSAKTESFALFFRFFKVKALRALYLVMLGNQIALWSLVFLLPDLLKERAHESWIVFGGGHLFLMLGATLGPPILGHLADKTSPRSVIGFTTLMTLLTYYLFLLPMELSELALFSWLFVLGSMLGSIPPLSWALGGQLVPESRGMVSAFLMGFVWIFSEGISFTFSGYFASLFSTNCAAWSLALIGTVQLLAVWASTQLPKRIDKDATCELSHFLSS